MDISSGPEKDYRTWVYIGVASIFRNTYVDLLLRRRALETKQQCLGLEEVGGCEL